jgi:hypothetical protein
MRTVLFAVMALVGCAGSIAATNSEEQKPTEASTLPSSTSPQDAGADASNASNAPDTSNTDAPNACGASWPPWPPACYILASSESSIPGVSIKLDPGVPCTFTRADLARGVTFPYTVVVDNDLPNVGIDRCAVVDASGLPLSPGISGCGLSYCPTCDVGPCAQGVNTVTLHAGTTKGSFSWDGRSWSGPSDWNAPKGPPFSPGVYTLKLVAKISQSAPNQTLEASVTMPVRIDP